MLPALLLILVARTVPVPGSSVPPAGALDTVPVCDRSDGWLPRFVDRDFAHLPKRRRPGDSRPSQATLDSVRRAWDAKPPAPTGQVPGTWVMYRDGAGQVTYFVTPDSFPLISHVLTFERGEQAQLRFAPSLRPTDRVKYVSRHFYQAASGATHSAGWADSSSVGSPSDDADLRWAQARTRLAMGACGGVPRASLGDASSAR